LWSCHNTTLLSQVIREYWPEFQAELASQGKYFPAYIKREFDEHLKCGRPEHGFLRVRCETYHDEKMVAFSCKRRGFCPSCGARRMADSAALLVDDILPHHPMRQLLSASDELTQLTHTIAQRVARYLEQQGLLVRRDSLFLVNDSGQLIEKLITSHRGLGSLQAGFREGSRVYLRDAPITVSTVTDLMDTVVLDRQAAEALNGRDWQVQGGARDSISWERFLLDLHAARFLSSFAKWFKDLMVGLILVLALSCVWLYRLKRNGNGNGQSGANR
jgi:hypothetical protein